MSKRDKLIAERREWQLRNIGYTTYGTDPQERREARARKVLLAKKDRLKRAKLKLLRHAEDIALRKWRSTQQDTTAHYPAVVPETRHKEFPPVLTPTQVQGDYATTAAPPTHCYCDIPDEHDESDYYIPNIWGDIPPRYTDRARLKANERSAPWEAQYQKILDST